MEACDPISLIFLLGLERNGWSLLHLMNFQSDLGGSFIFLSVTGHLHIVGKNYVQNQLNFGIVIIQCNDLRKLLL